MSDSTIIKYAPINSWAYIELLRSQLINSQFERDISLEQSWERLNDEYSGVIDREGKPSSTPLGDFLYSAELGFYPRPEILLFLAESFEYYFQMKGEISLEDIFFGKQKRGVGNYSAQQARKEMIQLLDFAFIGRDFSISDNPKATDLELAEEIVNKHNLAIDPESLLRKYRRYKRAK
jgi:hypothetical protein